MINSRSRAPTGFGPPRHIHPTEDEAFYLVIGTMDVVCCDDKWTVGPGDFVFLPKGIPHAFVVTNGPVEGLTLPQAETMPRVGPDEKVASSTVISSPPESGRRVGPSRRSLVQGW